MRFDWKVVVGLVLTVLLVWWALHDVAFDEFWGYVRSADPWLLLAAVFVATFGFVIRAMRWRVLLHPVHPGTTFRSRFYAVAVGFMTNNVLPARLGEFTRAYALSRAEPVPVTAAFGTLVVERVLDGLTLLAFLLVTMSWPTFPAADVLDSGPVGGAVRIMVALIGALIVGMVVFLVRPRPFIAVAERAAALLPGDFARPIVDALEAFLDALGVLRRPGLLALAVLWSVGFWLWHGLSFYLGMLAFGIAPPPDPFIAAIFTEAVVGFGVSIPSAPGFIGAFHGSVELALSTVYGVPSARTQAFAWGYHFGGWLPITVIGLWCAWRLGLSFRDMGESEERVERAVEATHPAAVRLLERRGGPVSRQDPSPIAAAVRIRAPAKVNLLLRVLAREPETGYHRLETLFQAVDWSDELEVRVGGQGMRLDVEGAGDLGPQRDNLVWRASSVFAAETGLVHGLSVRLRKRLPTGAGLGGGSSDAAATLRALNALFGEPVPAARLRELAVELGSDVPFFLSDAPLAVATGRGERLRPLPPLPRASVLFVVPPVHVATGPAYGALARRRAPEGTRPGGTAETLADVQTLEWAAVAARSENDFEATVLAEHPPVARAFEALGGHGARLVRLSGSGGAVFAVFGDSGEAARAAERVRSALGGAFDVRVVETLDDWPSPELLGPAGEAGESARA